MSRPAAKSIPPARGEANVLVETRIQNLDLAAAFRDYIERRMHFAMGRFANAIRRVTVRVCDLNGTRGGVDKCCRIRIELVRARRIDVREVDADLHAVIDRAAEKAGRVVARELSRMREAKNGRGTISLDAASEENALAPAR